MGKVVAWQLLGALALVLSSSPAAAPGHYRLHGNEVLPDKAVTPGAVDPKLTTAELCSPTYHTSDSRAVSLKTKRAACAEYGVVSGCPGSGYEIDHLVSIELGGSNGLANLWPQPRDQAGVIGFHSKDVVENRAHKAVCSGQLTLGQAQQGIAGDWYEFGRTNGFLN